MNRPLTTTEKNLVRWMLEHGAPHAKNFLSQLEQAQVTTWRCPCGCASINSFIQGHPEPSGGIHPIADFVFGTDEDLSGSFVFEQGGVLAGVEVYGLAGDAPRTLPSFESLRQLPESKSSKPNVPIYMTPLGPTHCGLACRTVAKNCGWWSHVNSPKAELGESSLPFPFLRRGNLWQ